MLTQFMTEANFKKKGFRSIATKILLQIIAKRGNILWSPLMSYEPNFDAMLVGFEQSKLGNRTVLTVTGSINSTFTQAYTNFEIFQNKDEKYAAMAKLLLECI